MAKQNNYNSYLKFLIELNLQLIILYCKIRQNKNNDTIFVFVLYHKLVGLHYFAELHIY
jgi:hypothetical protein